MSLLEPPTNRSAFRRLAFMILWLIVLDPFVPPILHRLETWRYEGGTAFRFENSDLFGLGPLVSYLREHPRGERRRVVFFGNSLIFGYLLDVADALPAQYEKQVPGTRVFNMAINGQETGTSYLVEKAIIDSVDVIFVQEISRKANPMLGSLIPVTSDDARAFGLQMPDPAEHRMKEWLGRVWRLYGSNERLQAALFGTSTRQYLYLNKRVILKTLLGSRTRIDKASAPEPRERPVVLAPRAPVAIARDRRTMSKDEQLVYALADFTRAHRKRIVFLNFEYLGQQPRPEIAQFNAEYAPFAERVVVMVPPTLIFDEQHLHEHGCRLVAAALAKHELEAEKELPRR